MKHRTVLTVLFLGSTLALAAAFAEDPPSASAPAAATPAHSVVQAKDLKWQDAPAGLPPGAKMAILHGDPAAAGVFAVRIKVPSGYRVPPHWHPADEQVTVISGEIQMGLGEKWDDAQAHTVSAGGFSLMPQGVRHFAGSKKGAVIQIHAMGPWGITYVNPADDPRGTQQSVK